MIKAVTIFKQNEESTIFTIVHYHKEEVHHVSTQSVISHLFRNRNKLFYNYISLVNFKSITDLFNCSDW